MSKHRIQFVSMPKPRPSERKCVAVLCLVGAAGFSTAPAQSVEPLLFEQTGVFRAERLTESSGVAASRSHAGVLWTHNDSGDDPIVYATNLAGEELGEHRLPGITAVDWEDIAIGPCFDRAGDCLYVADTGDNLETRSHVVIYVIREPDPRQRGSASPIVHSLRVRYPDRAHDVEAIAVTPGGEIYMVTKGLTGPIRVFCIQPESVRRDTVTALPVGTLSIASRRRLGQVVTGAAISASGARFVVRTYTQLFFYRRQADGAFTLDGDPCWIGLREPQGEGVDFLDEETLVLTSEAARGRPGTISTVRCPARAE